MVGWLNESLHMHFPAFSVHVSINGMWNEL